MREEHISKWCVRRVRRVSGTETTSRTRLEHVSDTLNCVQLILKIYILCSNTC